MSMSKKDYIAIAAAILNERTAVNVREQVRTSLAERIADVCEQDNSRFDRARFLAACGVQS